MKVNVRPILNRETDRLTFAFEEAFDGDFPDSSISFPVPIRVSGIITNQAGYMKVTLNAEVEYETACARCLATIRKGCSLSIEKGVAKSGELKDRDQDEYLVLAGDTLLLDEPIADSLYLSLPYRHLCREDCRGICFGCGKNLNVEACSCKAKTIDPRLAVLGQLLEDMDE